MKTTKEYVFLRKELKMIRKNKKDVTSDKNVFEIPKINKLITSMDVAKLAGVSQTSVSRVFNPDSSREVKQETREKVLKAAKELGYKPNFIARSMISKKTNIIGIVIGTPVGPFNTKVITNLTAKIQELGKQCLIFTVDAEQEIDKILGKVLQYQVDGIIVTAPALSREMANLCIQNETPVILFNRFVPGLNASSVYCDNIDAGRSVAKFLVECGYKRIAHITHEKQSASALERKIGFYGMLREANINNVIEENAEYTYESGYEVGMKLLNQEVLPEAIFCISDLIAMGIIDAAKLEFGLRIPEDIAVVGFDDIPMASWGAYNLTTVHQPVDLLVNETIDTLMELIENPNIGPISKMHKTSLVKRGSTAYVK